MCFVGTHMMILTLGAFIAGMIIALSLTSRR